MLKVFTHFSASTNSHHNKLKKITCACLVAVEPSDRSDVKTTVVNKKKKNLRVCISQSCPRNNTVLSLFLSYATSSGLLTYIRAFKSGLSGREGKEFFPFRRRRRRRERKKVKAHTFNGTFKEEQWQQASKQQKKGKRKFRCKFSEKVKKYKKKIA